MATDPFVHGRITSCSTNTVQFYDYVQELISVLPPNRRFIFLWDNLSCHNHPHLFNLIYSHGHIVIPSPPYSPELAPIEFVFNVVEKDLEKEHSYVDSEIEFVYKLRTIVGSIESLESVHCGYN